MNRNNKRMASSPCKNRVEELMTASMTSTDAVLKALKEEAAELRAAKNLKEATAILAKTYETTFVNYVTTNANHFSDLCKEVSSLRDERDDLAAWKARHEEKVSDIEKVRESVLIKDSRKEMASKMEVAMSQVKVLDLDFDRCIEDRAELQRAAKEKLRARIRDSEVEKYNELVRKSVVQVLARQTQKRKRREDGRDIWTAPVVLTMKDRQDKWDFEEVLRKSKVYPTFHWPKEFLDPMKKMREVLKTKVDENSSYVRLRPSQGNDGKWRIRADVKPKEGEGRFSLKASWEMPPIDEDVRKKVPDWHKPTWADVVRRRNTVASVSSVAMASGGAPLMDAAAAGRGDDGMEL